MRVATNWGVLDNYEPVPKLDLDDVTSPIPRKAYGAVSPWLREVRAVVSRTTAVLAEVSKRHRDGRVVSAADTLLHYLVDLLDANDMQTLNELLGALRANLLDRANVDLYDDRGLARLHNVLALTLKFADKLPARAPLRTAYRDAVARGEGTALADNTVKLL